MTLADLRGAPALINFWASWCDPCRHEAPELERLSRSLPSGAHLVGVDYTDQEDSARAFIRSYHWTFPILSDPDGIYGARFGFSGLPATVAIDARAGSCRRCAARRPSATFAKRLPPRSGIDAHERGKKSTPGGVIDR